MRMNFKLCMILSVVFLLACKTAEPLKSKKVERQGIEMLYGEISRQQLFFDYPEWKNEYDFYTLEDKYIHELKKLKSEKIEVDIFLGTWCSDSEREVPRFYKILDVTKFLSEENVKLFAVDRNKKLADDSQSKYNIQKVATFIFRKNGSELGRIIESPEQSLESDIIKILSSK